MEIQGGMPKIERKTGISRGVNEKKWKISGNSRGVVVKSTGNPGGLLVVHSRTNKNTESE